jgi:hypothetical protein
MGIFDANGSKAWAQYHHWLANAVAGGESEGIVVQPMAVSMRAEWDTDNAFRNLWYKQDLVETLPEWGPLYRRTSLSLPDSYQAFLDKLNTKIIQGSGIADREKLSRLNTEREAVRTRLNDMEKKADDQWKAYVARTPRELLVTRAKWEEDNGYAGERTNYRRQLNEIEGAYLLVVNDAGGELQEIGRALNSLSNSEQMPLPWADEVTELGREFWAYYYRATLNGDIVRFKQESAPTQFTAKEGQSETTTFESRWNASASVSWCFFFSASGSVEDEQRSERFRSETQSLTLSFQNVGVFDAVRTAWYKEGLIRRYANKIDPGFFGPSGQFPLVPTQVVLAHGLKLDIQVGQESRDFFYHRHSVGGGGGFGIGPFRFGGRGSSTTTYSNTKVTSNTNGLTIEDTSGRAVILAVISQRPHDWLDSDDFSPLWRAILREQGIGKALELRAAARYEDAETDKKYAHLFAAPSPEIATRYGETKVVKGRKKIDKQYEEEMLTLLQSSK